MGDSPTPPWLDVDRDAPAEAVGGVVGVEGPAPVPTPAMCEAMRRSMWACCSGVNAEVSALSRAGLRLWSDGVAVIAGVSEGRGDGTAVVEDLSSPDAEAACGALLSPDESVARWVRRRTSSCDLSP